LGELHGEGDFGIADRNGLLQAPGLLQITICLTRRHTAVLHHLLHRARQMSEPVQQLPGMVEALGFYDRAGAIVRSLRRGG